MVGWPHCIWVCGKAAHHGGEQVAEQIVILYQEVKRRRGRAEVPLFPLRDYPPNLQ
jgi:predicted nucleic acid-binding Zn ribbon protein